jgi:biotin transporter BioY
MVKHGFVLGWVFAWFLIGIWRIYFEHRFGIAGNVIFFMSGLILGTIVQTLMDRREVVLR